MFVVALLDCMYIFITIRQCGQHIYMLKESRWGEKEKEPTFVNKDNGYYASSTECSNHSLEIKKNSALFSFPPTSLKHEFYGLTSGFTRLIIETRYVYHGLISLHANFHDNRTK